jgi:pimeloyl-ACP methyl ester carboxylesterase
MAEQTGAEYVVIPASYHGPQVENPLGTVAVFDAFLSQH